MTKCATESCSAQNPPKSVKNSDIGPNLTLEKAIQIVRFDEIAAQQLKEMKDEPEQEAHTLKKKPSWRQKGLKSNAPTCSRCGRQHGGATCPAMGKVYRKCNAKNHFEKM